MMRIDRLLVAFFVLALISPPASAEIYRWVDDKGVAHFPIPPLRTVRMRLRRKKRLLLIQARRTVLRQRRKARIPLPNPILLLS